MKSERNANAIHYVFRRFWFKNDEFEFYEFKKVEHHSINCTTKIFAEYWNKNYLSLHKYKNGFKFKSNGQVEIKTFDQIGYEKCKDYNKILSDILSPFI